MCYKGYNPNYVKSNYFKLTTIRILAIPKY